MLSGTSHPAVLELIRPIAYGALLALAYACLESGFVRGRTLTRALLENAILMAVAYAATALTYMLFTQSLSGPYATVGLLNASSVSGAATGFSGRIRFTGRALWVAVASCALMSLMFAAPGPLPFMMPIWAGAGTLGGLVVLGARPRAETPGPLGYAVLFSVLGCSGYLIGQRFLLPLTLRGPSDVALLLAAIGVALPLAWLFRGRRVVIAVAAVVGSSFCANYAASGFSDWIAPTLQGAAIGGIVAVLSVLLDRSRIDDATGIATGLLAMAIAFVLWPDDFSFAGLAARLNNPLAFGWILSIFFGFFLALVLQITIGLRAPDENSAAPAPKS
jgi:hypothetical protein